MSSSMGKRKIADDFNKYKHILPVVTDEKKLYAYLYNYKLVKDKVILCDPPEVPELDETHKALGLNDFVHLDLLPSKDQNQREIEEFISFYFKGETVVHRIKILAKVWFNTILKLPSAFSAEVPASVPQDIESETAMKLLNAYVLKRYKSPKGYHKVVKEAIEAIQNVMAHTVDFAKIIEAEAFSELNILSNNCGRNPNWRCFYSAIWQKIIDVGTAKGKGNRVAVAVLNPSSSQDQPEVPKDTPLPISTDKPSLNRDLTE